jgi:predicted component of type VI protein secretion system
VIGRTPDCDIRINDKLLSKSQASISFDPDHSSWILTDGFNNKPSTNGTWLYLNENFEMHTGMIFKANQTIFVVDLKTGRISAR